MSELAALEPPSLKDELQRKAFEHIEHMAIELEHGRISEAQFDTGIRAIWACVGGLVDQWLIDTISEIRDKPDASWVDVRVLRKNGHVVMVRRRFGDGSVFVTPLTGDSPSKRFDYFDEANPTLFALNEQKRIVSQLISAGFEIVGVS